MPQAHAMHHMSRPHDATSALGTTSALIVTSLVGRQQCELEPEKNKIKKKYDDLPTLP
jgi:hypothetical protein